MKFLLNTLGTLCLLLALLGLVLPLLPTTPFLLLASACYVRGSERMHRWLLGNRWFGPQLRHYQTHRAISRRTKCVAIGLTWASLIYSMTAVGLVWLQLALFCLGVGITWFIARSATLDSRLHESLPAVDAAVKHEDGAAGSGESAQH